MRVQTSVHVGLYVEERSVLSELWLCWMACTYGSSSRKSVPTLGCVLGGLCALHACDWM